MNKLPEYYHYLESVGTRVATGEIATSKEDVIKAIEILQKNNVPILGGDIYTENENKEVVSLHEYLGPQYVYLNWSCDPKSKDSMSTYVERSCIAAKTAILKAEKVVQQLKMSLFTVLVVPLQEEPGMKI